MNCNLPHGHALMEGDGAYNRHATVQANGSQLGTLSLKQAAQDVLITDNAEPIFVVDYGASQGKNSLIPISAAINVLRSRIPAERSIIVVHTDLPGNDFSTLFEVLEDDSAKYANPATGVFYCAIGRSFFQQLLPRNSVLIGWAAYSAVWLSDVPLDGWNHIFPCQTTGVTRERLADQAASDWGAFLTARAAELQPGGKLVFVLPGLDANGRSGFEHIMNYAVAALAEMLEEASISPLEHAQMKIASYLRYEKELFAPFERGLALQGVVIEHYSSTILPDPGWNDFANSGDANALAEKQAQFFRSTFAPSLSSALDDLQDKNRHQDFAQTLQRKLIRLCAENPIPIDQRVQILVIAKPRDTGIRT